MITLQIFDYTLHIKNLLIIFINVMIKNIYKII